LGRHDFGDANADGRIILTVDIGEIHRGLDRIQMTQDMIRWRVSVNIIKATYFLTS
jgi:hypothetical protein